jgi:hypothetical protein
LSPPKPVFIVGNKRSGSTLLTNMLNEHPDVCITHESDIIWTLYQCHHGMPKQFHSFELDAPRGMDALLQSFGPVIGELLPATPSPVQWSKAFFEIQRRVIELGTSIHVPLKTAQGLKWIGDKKPVQHASPEIRDFILSNFTDARFVHVIRHPAAVVASQLEAARTWPVTPRYWHDGSDQVLERWRVQEEWVLELKASLPQRTHTIRLEDLCNRPVELMDRLFAFLDLEMCDELRGRMLQYVYARPNEKYAGFALPQVEGVRRIMDIYGYSASESGRIASADPPSSSPA